MRTIDTREWQVRQESLLLKNALFDKLLKQVAQILFYIPSQLNKSLNMLDVMPGNNRQYAVHDKRNNRMSGTYQYIPQRVWQRHSALLSLLEENKRAESRRFRIDKTLG